MIPLSVGEAVQIMGGRAWGFAPGLDQVQLAGVATDSRLVGPQMLFVAIPGDRVDGHDFVAQALQQGAVLALVSRAVDGPAIVVDDTVLAMGRLAAEIRRRLDRCRVIAVTGSSGKTSTKDLLDAVLGRAGPTVAPEGSFNTEVGVPMTIFRAEADTRYLVLEMGMRGPGHISTLVQMARPEIGIILNAGSAHLGMMGSRQAIVEAKAEILDLLPAAGFAVLPGDDPAILAQAVRTNARIVTFGEVPGADVRAVDVRLDEQARAMFTLVTGDQAAPVRLQSHGRHQVANALAVAATCLNLGLAVEWTAEALSEATTRSRWRMEVHRSPSGITVVNDAYNANPESMRAALAAVAAMNHGKRCRAILGQMLELGEASADAHAGIGRLAAELGVETVCVGAGTEPMQQAAVQAGGSSCWVPDPDAAVDLVAPQLTAGDVVLVKASRGIGLEQAAIRLAEMTLAVSSPTVSVGGGQ